MKKNSPGLRLVLATNNQHKILEISSILKKARVKADILTLADFPKRPPVVENKPTIEGNAKKKAQEVAKQTRCLALADDTGLFIDALKGKPGVISARFAGPKCNFEDNNRKVLRLLSKVPSAKRGAQFRCVAALANPKGKVVLAEGSVSGRIIPVAAGKKGFGYDPIFYVPRLKKTFAELGLKTKNSISHRGKAFSKVPKLLNQILKES